MVRWTEQIQRGLLLEDSLVVRSRAMGSDGQPSGEGG